MRWSAFTAALAKGCKPRLSLFGASPPRKASCMSNRFHEDVQETIERCRRLARTTHDMVMASKLLAMAEDLEKALKRSPGRKDDPPIDS